MTTIATASIELSAQALMQATPPGQAQARWQDWWRAGAAAVRRHLTQGQWDVRAAVIVVPQLPHVALVRSAWMQEAGASVGAWLPRMGTVASLAEEFGGAARASAPPAAEGAGIAFDRGVDGLSAHVRLLAQPWARQWMQRDAAGFAAGVARLVDAAYEAARIAHAMPPENRLLWLDEAQAVLLATNGPGLRERMLMLTALQWLAQSPAPASDVLFERMACAPGGAAQPWVLWGLMPQDPWRRALQAQAERCGLPCLCIEPPASGVLKVDASVAISEDMEDESQAAAARILSCVAIAQGGAPVALIAQDRMLVRRVRALLEPSGVTVADETGWKLSTARAAAAVMAWLRAAQARASSDELLDALKSGWALPPQGEAGSAFAALSELEAHLRRSGCRRAWEAAWPQAAADGSAAQRLWQSTQDALAPLRWSGRLPLNQALMRLAEALKAVGAWAALADDAAGRQVLAALRVEGEASGEAGAAWAAACAALQVDAGGLQTWVDRVLEQVSFVPDSDARPDVVITPMAKAAMRPYAAVVWPAMDDARFAEAEPALAWLGDGLAGKLGLPTRAILQAQTWQLLGQVMQGQPVHVSWRRQDGGRPLGPSPWWERWLAVHGAARAADDARIWQPVLARPASWPEPRLPQQIVDGARPMLWSRRLNASAYEYLRSCPYRFFAHAVLGLREDKELEEGVDARDFGTWLHELLRRFHADADTAVLPSEASLAHLQALAEALRQEWGWNSIEATPDFLPYAAALQRLLPAYVDWWIGHREAGASVLALEAEVQGQTPALRELGIALKGQLDRIDHLQPTDGDEQRMVLDYKTTSADRLKARMKPRLEDTQLAFYAALLMLQPQGSAAAPGAPLRAAYLSLEDRRVELAEHDDVMDSAEALLEGVAHDMQRLARGHPMRALGEGEVCEFCAARGLCRKDDWPDGMQPLGWASARAEQS